MEKIVDSYSIPCYGFENEDFNKNTYNKVKYQLHGFCNASNYGFLYMVYLRWVVEGRFKIGFLIGKSKVVLTNQVNWIISCKELEAAKFCAELMRDLLDLLKHLSCGLFEE